MLQARETTSGPPYVSNRFASVGGHPTVNPDIPICAVLIFLYLVGAISNMTIYQHNRRKGHKFPMSWAMFGFCMCRVATCVLRLAWATRPNNVRLAIAAQIFMNIGILVVYIVVLLLSLRVFRATHPKLGWNRLLGKTLTVSYIFLAIALLLTVSFTILTYYTLNTTLKSVATWVQRGSILYMMCFNVMSIILLLLSILIPRAPDQENFGRGSMVSKMFILGVALFFCVFIAGFRTGTAWSSPRPASNPAWYDTKSAFYIILFGLEIIIIYMFLFTRFDKTFWVPNGSCKAGDYSRVEGYGSTVGTESEQEKI